MRTRNVSRHLNRKSDTTLKEKIDRLLTKEKWPSLQDVKVANIAIGILKSRKAIPSW